METFPRYLLRPDDGQNIRFTCNGAVVDALEYAAELLAEEELESGAVYLLLDGARGAEEYVGEVSAAPD